MTAQAIPPLGSLYGLAEVQKVSTYWTYDADEGDGYTTAYANNATDGSFTLAFGAVDRALPGTVKMVYMKQYMTTSVDLTGHIGRGDAIVVNGQTMTVSARRAFNSTHLYVEEVRSGDTGLAFAAYQRATTVPIAHDASANAVEGYLEQLPSVGDVRVGRSYDEDAGGYVWSVTFLSDVGDLDPLVANPTGLLCALEDCINPSIRVVEHYAGVEPDNYTAVTVSGAASAATMTGLATGAEYAFRVTAYSANGYGEVSAVATATPAEEPGAPTGLARLSRHSTSQLLLQYEQSADDAGAGITSYTIQHSQSAAFPEGATVEQSFDISWVLFDEHEKNRTLVDVDHNGSLVTRSLANSGADERGELDQHFARGDFLRIGGQVFSVCLQTNALLHNVTLSYPVDDSADTYGWARYDDREDDLRQAPLYKLDTALSGSYAPELGDARLAPRLGDSVGTAVDWRSLGLRRGDYVREILIYCDPTKSGATIDNKNKCNLTEGATSASGYRLVFGEELTTQTTAGGEAGCLLWDGAAADLEAELEAIYYGVRYLVTFVGDLVRGNVPQLTVTDLGRDGCGDAEDAGRVAGSNATAYSATLQASTVPVWKAQTTAPLAWDAEAADVKYALENLAQLESEADTAFAYQAMVGLGANEDGLDAAVLPTVSVVPVREVVLDANVSGGPTYVRVAANNDYGRGEYRASSPLALTPSTQKPDPPAYVRAEVVSPTELLVEWTAPLNDGGQPVTSFKVEYDPSADRSPSAETTGDRYLGGFFALSFDGQDTQALPYDASAAAVEAALESLCTVDDVTGYTWLVTFESVFYGGDQHTRFRSAYQGVSGHKLAVDGANLLSCASKEGGGHFPDATDCFRHSANASAVATLTGSRQERQVFKCEEAVGASLSLQDADGLSIEEAIETVAGEVELSCYGCADYVTYNGKNVTWVPCAGENITVNFGSARGDVPPILCLEVSGFDCGDVGPVGSLEISVGRADQTIGTVAYASPDDDDAALRRRIALPLSAADDVDEGDTINVDGAAYVVQTVNADAYFAAAEPHTVTCATDVTCVLLTTPYVGRAVNASAPQIYAFSALAQIGGGIVEGSCNVYDVMGCRLLEASSIRVDWRPPALGYPEGNNGAAVSGYEVQLSGRQSAVQTLVVTMATPSFSDGSYALQSGNATTACIPVDADAATLELRLEELPYVDGVSVTRAATSTTETVYAITYDGAYVSNYHVDPLAVVAANVARGPARLRVATVSTGSRTRHGKLSGVFELAWDFTGFPDLALWANDTDSVVNATVDAGSAKVYLHHRTGANLTALLNPGDLVRIGGEGCDSCTVFVESTRLGHTLHGGGGKDKWSGRLLEDEAALVYFEEGLRFPPNRAYQTLESEARNSSAYRRQSVLVPFDASPMELEQALEGLPGLGSVEVSRFGPAKDNGFVWSTGAIYNGRSVFEKVGTPFFINWDANASSWELKANNLTLAHGPKQAFYYPRGGYDFYAASCVVQKRPDGDPATVPLLHNTFANGSAVAQSNDTYADARAAGVAPSFDDTVFFESASGGAYEVQAISLTADADDIDGVFTIAFTDTEAVTGTVFRAHAPVVVEYDATAEDVEVQLESLASVGRVAVSKTVLPTADASSVYGAVWTVTFLTQPGDLPLLILDGSSLSGTNVALSVATSSEGVDPTYETLATGLEPGKRYAARVRAVNSEGYGPWTDEPLRSAKGIDEPAQGQGAGVLPLSTAVGSVPDPIASVTVAAASASQFSISYDAPESRGLPIDSYLIEWTTASSFTATSETWTIELRNEPWGLADLQGRWSISVGSFETHPLSPTASADAVAAALNVLRNMGAVQVEKSATRSVATYKVSLLQDVGDLNGFAVHTEELQSISHPLNHSISGGSVNASGAPGVKPANYGAMMVYTEADGDAFDGAWRADGGVDVPKSRCGSVYAGLLDSWDSLQLLSLHTLDDQAHETEHYVDAGSYRLELGGELTTCIDYAASAIELLGAYVDGAWPQLRVDPTSFGKSWRDVDVKSGCEEFSVVTTGNVPLGKSNVTASIVPMAEHGSCASGNDEVQIVVAEADTALGGSLDLYFNGQVVEGFAVDGSPRDLEAALLALDGVDAVEVTKHVHADQPYGIAHAVTLTAASAATSPRARRTSRATTPRRTSTRS
ncbi:hypothetical protein JL721_2552 [Aureococcus anophagefferens]|nr:hypothetical protein JL721_2552 [Aureococcus anophagefferens]